ncbi:hypothetical protein E4T42_09753 [Aureobasidium subglaciale]|nr:hypothetical protein E4T42_09753 [Aureobasidium subglaciale]
MSPRDSPTHDSYTILYSLICRQQNKNEHVSLHNRTSSSLPISTTFPLFLFLLSFSFSCICISAESSLLLSFASLKSLNHSHSVHSSDCLYPKLTSGSLDPP